MNNNNKSNITGLSHKTVAVNTCPLNIYVKVRKQTILFS